MNFLKKSLNLLEFFFSFAIKFAKIIEKFLMRFLVIFLILLTNSFKFFKCVHKPLNFFYLWLSDFIHYIFLFSLISRHKII